MNHKTEFIYRSGQEVRWMQKSQMIDHPEGKMGRYGMLKIMRTIELSGKIIHQNIIGYDIKPHGRHYTISVPEEVIIGLYKKNNKKENNGKKD